LVLWHPLINDSGKEERQRANEGLKSLYRNVLDLQATTQRQSFLKNSIVNIANEIAQKKRILESSDRDTAGFALLAICLFWYFINFMTYFLFAPVTRVSVTILVICAFSVSLAFFVIFEHEVFGSGLISIPREQLTSALPPLTAH
jgi:ABC-type amino acid transport system permease subunit